MKSLKMCLYCVRDFERLVVFVSVFLLGVLTGLMIMAVGLGL